MILLMYQLSSSSFSWVASLIMGLALDSSKLLALGEKFQTQCKLRLLSEEELHLRLHGSNYMSPPRKHWSARWDMDPKHRRQHGTLAAFLSIKKLKHFSVNQARSYHNHPIRSVWETTSVWFQVTLSDRCLENSSQRPSVVYPIRTESP